MVSRAYIRRFLMAALLVLVTAITVVVIRNFRGAGPEEFLQEIPGQVDLALKEVRYTETRGGRREWTLVADQASYQREGEVTRIANIQLTFHAEKEGEDVRMTAREGEIRLGTHSVEVWGDVVVSTGKGSSLHTERARYRQSEGMVVADGPVRLISPGLEVTGKGMRLWVESRRMKLLSDVEARLQPQGLKDGKG